MTLETLPFLLLVLGLAPHRLSRSIVRSRQPGRRYLVRYQVHALFWQLTIDRPRRGRSAWRFTVPAIQRLSGAVWAALRKLVAG